MNCPKCPNCRLRPYPKVRGRAAAHCPNCGGQWLHPEHWPDSLEIPSQSDAEPKVAASDLDGKAGLCPEGHGILIRAEVNLEPSFYLDRCPHCVGVWFDRGEWQRVASSHLLETLPMFWSEAWQRKQLAEENLAAYRERINSWLGEELLGQLETVAEELRGHPRREEALVFLRNESRNS